MLLQNDVFGEVAGVVTNPEEERKSKIDSILASIKSKSVETKIEVEVKVPEEQQVVVSTVDENKKTIDEHDKNTYYSDNGDKALKEIEEVNEGLLSEINELEQELATMRAKGLELEAQNEYLQESIKGYMKKVNAYEFDSDRQNVPRDFKALIRYYQESKEDGEYSNDAKKNLESEMFRLTERLTGKSLSSYISDYKVYGSEEIQSSGLSSMGVSKQPIETKKSQYAISASESPF